MGLAKAFIDATRVVDAIALGPLVAEQAQLRTLASASRTALAFGFVFTLLMTLAYLRNILDWLIVVASSFLLLPLYAVFIVTTATAVSPATLPALVMTSLYGVTTALLLVAARRRQGAGGLAILLPVAAIVALILPMRLLNLPEFESFTGTLTMLLVVATAFNLTVVPQLCAWTEGWRSTDPAPDDAKRPVRPREELVGMRGQVGELRAPAELRESEVEVAQRAADRDVGQRVTVAVAPGLLAEAAAHRREARVDLAHLAIDPLLALLLGRALRLLEAREDQRVGRVGRAAVAMGGERPLREVHLDDVVGDDPRAEPLRLLHREGRLDTVRTPRLRLQCRQAFSIKGTDHIPHRLVITADGLANGWRMFAPGAGQQRLHRPCPVLPDGLRCFARYVVSTGRADARRSIAIETSAGIKTAVPRDRGLRFEVDMGRPGFRPGDLPVAVTAKRVPILDHPVTVAGQKLGLTLVSMGNPHAVHFLADVGNLKLCDIGPRVENHALFPRRVNFEIARVVSRREVQARVWERGAGETLSCGTGACAIAVASRLHDYVDSPVDIKLPGGTLSVKWDKKGSVYLTGPAELVFTGEWPGR